MIVRLGIVALSVLVSYAAKEDCVDEHPLCRFWSRKEPSECKANPQAMSVKCRASCGTCELKDQPARVTISCKNEESDCDGWASRGECETNAYYMLWKCSRACKFCSADETVPYPAATDKLTNTNQLPTPLPFNPDTAEIDFKADRLRDVQGPGAAGNYADKPPAPTYAPSPKKISSRGHSENGSAKKEIVLAAHYHKALAILKKRAHVLPNLVRPARTSK